MTRLTSLAGLVLVVSTIVLLEGRAFSQGGTPKFAATDIPAPHWIWPTTSRNKGAQAHLAKSFDVPQGLAKATMVVMTEYCDAMVQINGQTVASIRGYEDPVELDIVASLRPGKNTISIRAVAKEVAPALALRLVLQTPQGEQYLVTDQTWSSRTSTTRSFGRVAAQPWLISPQAIEINPFDDYTQWKRAIGEAPDSEPGKFQTAAGFEVHLIRAAEADEGSWVSMAVDPQGRFVIAREDKGLLRMTLADDGDRVAKVETINDDLLECRGLLFAHDSLYANANNSKGLYRLRDTDGDDQFETVELLYRSSGGVGHGRNDLALGPDGRIYSIHGDSVDLPTKLPDLTSPFREQRRGAQTREGHVIRLNADGSKIELVTAGLRNPFGIDFNADGEMFTYDADAEFDMGSPWYRPTRVNQLVPGGDYGWRGVTGNWPPYFTDHPDNAVPTLDIGKGSPTAVKFGHRSNFPQPYQDALYILDWAYGRVLVVHLVPRGAGYFGRAEPFLRGRPLNVTDLDFGPDGAMYLVTGGRKTQSGLYRVRYIGTTKSQPATAQQVARGKITAEARQQRRALEALLSPLGRDAVDRAWHLLASDDPQLAHAARMAIEHQPVDTWKARAIDEPNRRLAVWAMLSLARSGKSDFKSAIVNRLNGFSLEEMSTRELQAAVYTYQLCLTDDAKLSAEQKRAAILKIDALYPQSNFDTNRILGEMLVTFGVPSVVPKTLARLAAADRQAEQMHCLHLLRNARAGWSSQSREVYFSALRQSDDYLGGQGMPGFIETIRQDGIASLNEAEKRQLGSLIEPRSIVEDPPPGPPRPFVRKWKLADLANDLGDRPAAPDYARGQKLFTVALCARCHRLGTEGRSVGPELTSVAQRFSRRDLLKEILEPSSTIAENHRRRRIITNAGKVYEGQVIFGGDYRSPVLRIAIDPLAPARLTEILKADIESSQPSPQSFMPEGLLDTFEKDEVLDLLAYLRSGGLVLATTNGK
jgi:putative heme-binding domain-containing protein